MSITLTTSGSINGSYQLTSCGGTTNNSTTTESNGVVTVTAASGHGGIFTVTGCDFAGQFYYDVNSGAVGTPYTMTASATNVTSATSQPFAATGYGAAAQMEYIVEPTGGIASSTGTSTATMNSFQVAIEDSWGNILSGQGQAAYAGSISMKVTGGAALTCTTSSSQGIFTFSNCAGTIGSGLTLTATATGTGSSGVTPEVSSTFNNTGPVASLVWYSNYPQTGSSPQPVAGASGSVMTNQPVLAYEDAGLNTGETGPQVVTAETASVSYTAVYSSGTKSTTSPNGVLSTCSNLPPTAGIIAAGNCTFIGLVGTNYTMSATTTSGPTITSAASSTFSPTGPGPASQLVFTPSPGVEPVAAAAGSQFSTEPVVVVEDAGGNVVSSATTQVEMNSYLYNSAAPTNPTTQSGSLLNCSTLAPVNGAVSLIPVSGYLDVEGSCAFGGVVGTSYQLVATAPNLTSAVSTTFSPTTFGPASAISVTGCSSGVKWHSTCVLSATVQDAWGNTVTSFNSGVTFADVGGAGAVTGLGTFTASSGIATDTVTGSSVGPEQVGASEGSVTSATPDSFSVIGDTTVATVSETPTSVVYGHESSSVFTVTVVTGNHEVLPTTDSVTVNVGSASCVASVAPSGTGGSGTCSIANSALPVSATPYTVTATYPGDSELQASSQATAPTGFTVTKDTTTATVSESPTSVVYGNESASVFTVSVVTGYHEVLPTTDLVTVNVGSTYCVASVAPAGNGGTGTCSIANAPLAASGTPYAVTATYSGDTDLSASTLATAPTGLTVTKDTTTVAVSASPTSVTYGNEGVATFEVDVNPANGENLPGVEPVTINVGSASCVASVQVNTVGTCSIATTALPASGSAYAVTATYPGDTDLSASAQGTAPTGLTVNKDTSTITVSESPTSVVYGAESTSVFTVNVNPTYGENLPGVENVTVNVGSTSCVASVAVTTVGTCSITNTALTASATPYTVSATYPGDADISLSATATAPTGLTVTKATPPAITWATPTAITYGTLLSSTQLNATDTLPGTFVYSPASGALLTVGSQTLGVTFNPTDSTDYSSATKNVTLTVNKDTSTATVSETPTTQAYGHEASTTFTVAVVTGNHEVLPSTDSVTINVGTASCVASVTPSGTGGTGSCTIGATALVVGGPYAVTATYGGDADVAAASTATATTGFSVTKDTSTATVSETPTTQAYGHEASTTFTVAVVTGNHEVLPSTDSVTINVGTASCVASVTPSGTGGTGSCTIGATALVVGGPYAVTATYGGDADVAAASTATATTGFSVTKDTSTVSVSETPTSVTYGAEGSSVFTVDVNPAGGENLIAVENVTVTVGTTSCVAAVQVNTIGTCSITASALAASGTAYTVTATYNGDADISASSQATAPTGLTVNKAAPPAITWGTPAAITYGVALSGTQLNATDTLGGTFAYSPVSGTVLPVGTQTLTTTFTPTNSTDYTTAFASVSLVVNKDTSTVTVSESPTSEVYGSEGSTNFSVTVVTGHGENLPAVEPVTINVGTTSCVASVAVTKTGTCTIANTALPPSGTAYAVTATYPGDADISASAQGTAATGFTVTKYTPTVVVTDTTNPTGIGAGNLVMTATVTGTGSTGPTGTITWALKLNGTTNSTCTTATLTQGSGTSTATCTFASPGAGTYTLTAAYGGDTNYGSLTSPSTLGVYIGGTNANVPTGPEYYTINSGTSTGSATSTANTIAVSPAETLTSITMTFSGGATSSANQTVTVGKVTGGTYSATTMSCTVPANSSETCSATGSVAIASGSSVNMAAIGNSQHTDFWIVTYTNP